MAAKTIVDNSIVNYELHTHQPFASVGFENNDEIRITIPEVDNYTLPCDSHLYIEGRLVQEDGTKWDAAMTKIASLVSNGVAHLFSEIRYEMNGITVDTVRNVGLSSTMKGYFSKNRNEMVKLENAGWHPLDDGKSTVVDDNGHFNVCIPLSTLLGFAEDFQKIVMNVRQELVLIRSNDDKDALICTDNTKKIRVKLDKILWKVPHIVVGLKEQLSLIKYADKNTEAQVPFRSWEIHEYPALPATTKHSWAVKTATQLETPRYIIIGFQTNKKNKIDTNTSRFDNINLTNLTVFLNSERYPYDNMHISFDNNQIATLYETFARFRQSYYGKAAEPLFSPSEFKTIAPLVGVDCTYQKDTLHKSAVEIRIEFTTNANIPDNTSAYCLILHDKLFQYSPLTKIVRQR